MERETWKAKCEAWLADESGAELVEWIVVAVTIAVATFAVLLRLGDTLMARYQSMVAGLLNR